MLTNVLRAISPAHPASAGTELEIGSADAGIFSCPQCARPLGSENTRCPGCGTRLILGVPSQRAAVFATLGGAAGRPVRPSRPPGGVFGSPPRRGAPAPTTQRTP